MSTRLERALAALGRVSNPAACEKCGHVPIRHIEGTCLVCLFLNEQIKAGAIVHRKYAGICTERFTFHLSEQERTQAKMASPDAYKQDDICSNCGQYWVMHEGYLCPSGDSTFILLFKGGTEA